MVMSDLKSDPRVLQQLSDVAQGSEHIVLQQYMLAMADASGALRKCCKEEAGLLKDYLSHPSWKATGGMGERVHYDIKIKVIEEWEKVADWIDTKRFAYVHEADAEHGNQCWWQEKHEFFFVQRANVALNNPPNSLPLICGVMAGEHAHVDMTLDPPVGVDSIGEHIDSVLKEGQAIMVSLWDNAIRDRVTDVVMLYEDRLLLYLPTLHTEWEEKIERYFHQKNKHHSPTSLQCHCGFEKRMAATFGRATGMGWGGARSD